MTELVAVSTLPSSRPATLARLSVSEPVGPESGANVSLEAQTRSHPPLTLGPLDKADAAASAGGEKENKEPAIQLEPLASLLARLSTRVNEDLPSHSPGLTNNEASDRLLRNGKNSLTPPKELPEIVKYLKHYLDPLHVLLLASGVFSCIAYRLDESQPLNLWLGVVLFVVTFLSATFSYVQEGRSTAVMKSFRNMLPRKTSVIREGVEQQTVAENLVVGDIVRVGTGDIVPADLRVFWTADAKVEIASLTGESVPVTLTTTSSEDKIEYARNVAFSTSLCLEGEFFGIVYATGDHTMIGKIASLASGTGNVDTPLQREMKYFVRNLFIFAICLGVAFFAISLGRGQYTFVQAIVNVFIVVLVACVPQGLPMTVVSCLTITAKRMAACNVWVKQLQSVETLGSATVIASDKTGTLTMNKMSVSRLWFDFMAISGEAAAFDMPFRQLPFKRIQAAEGSADSVLPTSAVHRPEEHTATLKMLELVAACCNRAAFDGEAPLTEEEASQQEMLAALNELDPSMTLHTAKRTFPEFLLRLDSNLTLDKAKRQYEAEVTVDKPKTIKGDASDTALFNFINGQFSVPLIRHRFLKVFEQPFNSKNKFSIVIVKPNPRKADRLARADAGPSPAGVPGQTDLSRVLMMKGAPEIVLARCTHYMYKGQKHPIDHQFTAQYQAAYESFGKLGERVLGFASTTLEQKEYPPERDSEYSVEAQNYPVNGLTFLGLISLIDPPKPSVPGAIARVRAAGVKVIMVTGDHPLTAAAIARHVGIITGATRSQLATAQSVSEGEVADDLVDAIVIHGADLNNFSQADWDRVLSKREIVFARTTPAQKLQIVENLQRRNEIVAVTGDGVNDSPALKKANIGVAMGISGSDVARDAADVVLMDDEIASLVIGIREGRTIFDNLMKTISYTVTHLIPETIPVLLFLCAGLPLGLSSLQILTIDLGTELAPAIALAYEKAETNIMNIPPRNSLTDRLVSARQIFHTMQAGVVQTLCCYLAYFLVFSHHGIPPSALPGTDSYWVADADPLTVNGTTFTDDEQVAILSQAQTAYWSMLTLCQVFHIFLAKTRTESVFIHGFFSNVTMLYGVVIEFCIIVIIVFLPWSQEFFATARFPSHLWALLLVSWGAFLVLFEGKKLVYRHFKAAPWAKYLVW